MSRARELFERLEGVWENRLDSRWQDKFGWSLVTQPKLGESGPSDFVMRVDQLRESITFKKLRGLTRNVGVTGEAGFWLAMSYEASVDKLDGEQIHQEMGHFLLRVLENGETQEPLRAEVIRQATIPRANAMMTLGQIKRGTIAGFIDSQQAGLYDAKPHSSDGTLQQLIDNEFSTVQQAIAVGGGPDFRRSLEWLKETLSANPVGDDWVLELHRDESPSQMASGERVVNPVQIGRLLSDFWIGRRARASTEVDLLQYVQKVDLIFNGMKWPHIALNTLVKQS